MVRHTEMVSDGAGRVNEGWIGGGRHELYNSSEEASLKIRVGRGAKRPVFIKDGIDGQSFNESGD